VEWVNEAHSVSEITALANELHSHQIVYVFVYTSYLKVGGYFNPTFAHARDFVDALKRAQPDIKVLAWIGLPLSYVNLGEPGVRQKITAFCADVIKQEGFDGIHLDPEEILDGDRHVLSLLDETRQAISVGGANPLLSIATHKIWPLFPDLPWTRYVGPIWWSSGYFREVASRVDQVAVMTYDSAVFSPALYRLWSRFQVIQVSKALAGLRTELLFGVPTSEEETPTHHIVAENMASGLQGIIDGLNDNETQADAVSGVAIYPYWETDASEWALYDKQWLGN
jgi:hypothetical protein